MAKASNILGFAMAGGRSHHMNIVRIGQELAERGHNFSMLVSDKDDIGTETLSSKGFLGLQVHTFRGPLHIGTEKWASELSRDPRLVSRLQDLLTVACQHQYDISTVQQTAVARSMHICVQLYIIYMCAASSGAQHLRPMRRELAWAAAVNMPRQICACCRVCTRCCPTRLCWQSICLKTRSPLQT